jgi:hypothetical protein
MSGRRPRMLVRRPWSASGVLCAAWAAGCRVVRRRGSECERRYVGMAVPEGGVGGLCAGRGGLVGCRGGGPESLAVLRTSTLCHKGDKFDLAQFLERFVFFSYVGVSRVCSSHSRLGVFSSAWLEGKVVLASVSSACISGGLEWACPRGVASVGLTRGVLYCFRPVFS